MCTERDETTLGRPEDGAASGRRGGFTTARGAGGHPHFPLRLLFRDWGLHQGGGGSGIPPEITYKFGQGSWRYGYYRPISRISRMNLQSALSESPKLEKLLCVS